MLVCVFLCTNCTRDRGCSAPGLPCALCSQRAKRLCKPRAHRAARMPPFVIAREGGRSSIPEAFVVEPISRGVLDPPPSRGMTAAGGTGPSLVADRSAVRDDAVDLPQPQLIIPFRRHLVASCTVGRRAAAVAGDDAGLLALDVGVDPGHPGIDLIGQ